MKKILCAIVSLCVVGTMSFTLVSCGNKEDKPDKPSTSQQSNNDKDDKKEDKEDDKDTGDNSSSKQFKTVKDMLKSPAMQSALDTVKKQSESLGMKLEVYGEGDSIVYEYTYTTQIEVNDTMKDAIKKALDAQSSVFKNVVSTIEMQVEVKNPKCVIKYLNADGSEIYTQEFTK